MPTISIRVSDAQKIELEDRSARYGGNVSDYVKETLFGTGEARDREILARLEELAVQLSTTHTRQTAATADPAIVMLSEIVIMLRMSLAPNAIRAARGELARLNIDVWEPAGATAEHNRG